MSFLEKLFGSKAEKEVLALKPLVEAINNEEKNFISLSDEELKEKTTYFKQELSGGKTLDDILPQAFAAVREAAKRALGQRHFDVQLMGGIMLHRRGIAEMRTGEGKTLVATLPAYLNALEGKGVHVITVNDYLSRRDGVWMGEIYNRLGLSVGVVNHNASYRYDPTHQELDREHDETGSFKVLHEFLRPCTRREAYAADITYGTNNEFGFDYLRDHLVYNPHELTQRGFHYAIVDEVDSILIDEARTPLIIAGPALDAAELYRTFADIAGSLVKDEDYTVEEKHRQVLLTDAGIEKAEKRLGMPNIYTEGGMKYVHHLETAVKAKALYEKDKEYVVKDGEVIIVDEFTGRLQPGRRWSEGLHQAIEAKEGVSLQRESQTVASVTFQNYFRLYKKLSGMTGTAATSSEEFYKVYGIEVAVIPTNKEPKRADHNDFIFQTEAGKWKAVAKVVREKNEKGQPVLIGTASIEKNELLSAYLKQEGVPHELLNAKNHEREGEIIAQAGRKGMVTVATNLAGRGVDIKLGGNPATAEDAEAVRREGGLFVLGTERHEARRIDNQLRGRAGRQGDPGETQFFVSLEDTLMRVFASDTIKTMMGRFGIPEDEPIENSIITKALETAQTKIEGFNFDARKHVLEYDDVLNHQRKSIYERRQEILTRGKEAVAEELAMLIAERPELEAVVKEKVEAVGDEQFHTAVQRLYLQTIDALWIEHLETMDYLRGSVNLRAYGQRDPLIEYKREGLRLFKDLEGSLNETVARLIPTITADAYQTEEQKQLKEVHESGLTLGAGESQPAAVAAQTQPTGEKINRNDPCPCGSGKKYKKCHGQ